MNANRVVTSTVAGILGVTVLGAALGGGAAVAASRHRATPRTTIETNATYCAGLSGLVKAGTITQQQADAVDTQMTSFMESGQLPAGATATASRTEVIRTVLAPLVAKGTINDSQLAAIVTWMNRYPMMGEYNGTDVSDGYGMMGSVNGSDFGYGMMNAR